MLGKGGNVMKNLWGSRYPIRGRKLVKKAEIPKGKGIYYLKEIKYDIIKR